jgi:hypothetical protein
MENQPKQKTKWWKIVLGVFVLLIIIGSLLPESKTRDGNEKQDTRETIVAEGVALGQTLVTPYFDVVINSARVEDRVRTGNQFSDLKPESGNRYLIMNVSYKNTDSESRMITDGILYIEYNGKQYKFDHSENVMAEGWGIFLDQINPLTLKTTNLVYKIPAEITGPAYFQPGRSSKNQFISIGEIE